jgi:hypothetical protein
MYVQYEQNKFSLGAIDKTVVTSTAVAATTCTESQGLNPLAIGLIVLGIAFLVALAVGTWFYRRQGKALNEKLATMEASNEQSGRVSAAESESVETDQRPFYSTRPRPSSNAVCT